MASRHGSLAPLGPTRERVERALDVGAFGEPAVCFTAGGTSRELVIRFTRVENQLRVLKIGLRADEVGDLASIESWHRDVDDDEGRAIAPDHGQEADGAIARVHVDTSGAQTTTERACHERVVVENQDAAGAHQLL